MFCQTPTLPGKELASVLLCSSCFLVLLWSLQGPAPCQTAEPRGRERGGKLQMASIRLCPSLPDPASKSTQWFCPSAEQTRVSDISLKEESVLSTSSATGTQMPHSEVLHHEGEHRRQIKLERKMLKCAAVILRTLYTLVHTWV